jgi:methyl-accepting chemotaxis protein
VRDATGYSPNGVPKVKLPQFSIATKLYAIFALLATVTVALAVVAVVNARHHQVLTDEFDATQAGAQNVERANGLIYAVMMEARGIFLARDVAAAGPLAEGLLSLTDRIGGVIAEWQTRMRADDAPRFVEFSTRAARFQNFARELANIATRDGPQVARAWGDTGANQAMQKALNDDLGQLAQVYAHGAARIHGQIDRHIAETAWLTSLLTAFAVLLAAAGAFTIRHAIARPLATITHVTEQVAAGGAQIAVPYRDRGDEVGALARSIAVFQDAMRRNEELSKMVVDDAQARAHRQERISTEITHFGADVEATLAELGSISDQMLAASTQLSGAADNATQCTTGASAASEDASANVRDIASATEELASSVAEIDRQVTQSNGIATRAVSETEKTNATVAELSEAAGRIGDVVRLITDIAEQTNLLALNATIEAARAGDAGRGFAVVAGEVKALAGQTARATEDITTQIAAMQQATVRSIEAIGTIESTIRSIGEITGAIAAAVTQQGAATQEIARSVETAARRTNETAGEVERVGGATAATRESANAVQSVAGDLGTVAARLRGQVDQFFAKLGAA